ncbi:NUMOD3 domain-containing DNA-binding protein [Candidatus Dojkabacteria bacterium]|jgi:hypothetical protein|nr:NUMOD3 domain-containing DNA-binding protein [Candidatus Dojkabacteria bacterium]
MIFTEANIKKHNIKITINDNFKNIITRKVYYYHYACIECGYPHLGNKNAKFCDNKCAKTGENNYNFGRIGELAPCYGRTGKLHPMFGKTGELHPLYQGENSITKQNIPLYDTYAPQLEPIEKCVRDPEDPNILNVFCSHSECKKQYRPTRSEVRGRIYKINEDKSRFYCSDDCKQACPLFGQSAQQLMEYDAINAGNITKPNQEHIRINQRTNKKRRYESNGGICDWCEIKVTLGTSILHHEKPVSYNFLVADDPDNHWLFCKKCDKKAHQLLSCNYYELRLRRVCKN